MLRFRKASASDLHQVTLAAKQAMCLHMADAAGCKGKDAGVAEMQQLFGNFSISQGKMLKCHAGSLGEVCEKDEFTLTY